MSEINVASEVKKIIAEALSLEEGQVTEEAKFIDDLGADSLDTVELIINFEEKFDIEIPDEDAQKIKTVGEAISYIENKLGK